MTTPIHNTSGSVNVTIILTLRKIISLVRRKLFDICFIRASAVI